MSSTERVPPRPREVPAAPPEPHRFGSPAAGEQPPETGRSESRAAAAPDVRSSRRSTRRNPSKPPNGGASEGLLEAVRDSIGFAGRRDRQSALVPRSSIAGRALVIVIAIMTFLASITAGSVDLIASASEGWSQDVTREMTIQVMPREGRDLQSDVEAAASIARGSGGVAGVRIYSLEESRKLLEPWLGSALQLDEMPIPRLIVISADRARSAEVGTLRAALEANVPTALLDDHRQWSERLATMARSLVLIGFGILTLVLVATGLAIAFATQGAMAGTREIINVLHLVGAEHRFIADEFQRHFLMTGLRGSAAGGVLAILVFITAGLVSERIRATPEGEQVQALFGTFGLGARGYGAIVIIVLIVAGLTAIVTRLTVYRNLRGVT